MQKKHCGFVNKMVFIGGKKKAAAAERNGAQMCLAFLFRQLLEGSPVPGTSKDLRFHP